MKKYSPILVTASIFLFAALVVVGVWIYQNLSSLSNAGKLISVVSQLKDYDEKKLAEYNPASQRAVDVKHYTIKIDLHPEQKKILGDVDITLRMFDHRTDKVDLNFYENLKIKKVEFNGTNVSFDRAEKILSIHKTDKNLDSADIRIIYEGTPENLGFGSFTFGNEEGSPTVYSLNEPVFASTWFPCVDLPDDKALADIYITNDSSEVSLSNGKLIDIQTHKSRRTYHWKTFYPISTYLIALYSAKYKSFSEKYVSINRDTVNLYCYALPKEFDDAKNDFSDHPDYMKTFEKLFGPYPFPKEKYAVAEFWWQMGAMEHQTITGIGSNFISGKKFFSDMLIHELAHHWWGDAVGPKTWKDVWLNEGFATYSVALYWEKRSGFKALQSTMNSKIGSFDTGTLYNPGNAIFGQLVYDKGAWVLHMLRKEVGDSSFFKILRQYFKQYKYGNASTYDFKSVCEKVSGKNLDQFFNEWVFKGKGIIELEYDWNTKQTGQNFSTIIHIKQLQKGYDIYKFPVDIKMIFDNDDQFVVSTERISSKEQKIKLESKKKPTKIILDPDGWLLADIKPKSEN